MKTQNLVASVFAILAVIWAIASLVEGNTDRFIALMTLAYVLDLKGTLG